MRVEFKGEIVSKDVMEENLNWFKGRERGYLGYVEFDVADVEFGCTISGSYSPGTYENPPEAPQMDDLEVYFPFGENYLVLPLEDIAYDSKVPELRKLYDRIEESVFS